ncbi:MAG: hypothetical protein JW772_02150 [Candidatus Diapherotrites archaeon]|nr:hypothetical protein [Candidatus Diapherotrites archaeon]
MKKTLFLALIIVLFIPGFVSALTCSLKAACGAGETDIMHLSAATNAHAEIATQSNYGQKVCCSHTTPIGTSCAGNHVEIVNLSAATNAHAEDAALANYATKVCISGVSGGVALRNAAACNAGEVCVVSLSSTTNAHLADCTAGNAYPNKACVNVSAPSLQNITVTPANYDLSNRPSPDNVVVEFTIVNPSGSTYTPLNAIVEVSLPTLGNHTANEPGIAENSNKASSVTFNNSSSLGSGDIGANPITLELYHAPAIPANLIATYTVPFTVSDSSATPSLTGIAAVPATQDKQAAVPQEIKFRINNPAGSGYATLNARVGVTFPVVGSQSTVVIPVAMGNVSGEQTITFNDIAAIAALSTGFHTVSLDLIDNDTGGSIGLFSVQVRVIDSGGPGSGTGIVIKSVDIPAPVMKDDGFDMTIVSKNWESGQETGTIRVNIEDQSGSPVGIAEKTDPNFTMNADGGEHVSVLNYTAAEISGFEDGIYTARIRLEDSGGALADEKTVSFAVILYRTASIPETNPLGILMVLAGVLIVVGIAKKRN